MFSHPEEVAAVETKTAKHEASKKYIRERLQTLVAVMSPSAYSKQIVTNGVHTHRFLAGVQRRGTQVSARL